MRLVAPPCWTTWVSSWASSFLPASAPGVVPVGPDVDVGAVGKGLGAQIAVHLHCRGVGVDPHVAKAGAKVGFHVAAHLVGQRAAAALVCSQAFLYAGAGIKAAIGGGLALEACPERSRRKRLGLDLLLLDPGAGGLSRVQPKEAAWSGSPLRPPGAGAKVWSGSPLHPPGAGRRV